MVPSDLRGRMIAAVPVPVDDAGRIDREAQASYVGHLARQPVDGVAVWAHTGRGLYLSAAQRAAVLGDWKAAFGAGKPVVAAAGIGPETRNWEEGLSAAR